MTRARSLRQTSRTDWGITESIRKFRDRIQEGPYVICLICNRMLYKISVKIYRPEKYPCVIQNIVTGVTSYDNKRYICHTCHNKAIKGNVPCQAVCNKLEPYDVPPPLKCLRKLESVLVSRRIMSEKIMIMPKGQQKRSAALYVTSQLTVTRSVKLYLGPQSHQELSC